MTACYGHKKTGGQSLTGSDQMKPELFLNTRALFEPGFKFFTERIVANAIFYKRLHITELITAVMALTFHMVSFNGLFLDQHINGIGKLDFITRSWSVFASRGQISALRT